MQVKDLIPGSKVEIHLVQKLEQAKKSKDKSGMFLSAIYDINDDDTIDIYMPTENGKLQVLPKGICFEFEFIQTKGIFQAEGIVKEHLKKGSAYLIRVQLSQQLKKIQRREYFRMECLLPLMFTGIDEMTASYRTLDEIHGYLDFSNELKVRGMGTMLDISGGGARFVSTNSLEGIEYLLMQFTLENEGRQQEIETVARMINSAKMPDDNKYVHRVQFEYKEPKVKEIIISYIFEEERRIRKKGQGI